ncbi:MAG: hypothetical protein JXQ76_08780 [Campylobacterales bacterium]|nr:hypothetical protein [Campylobacterales bacterium]
MRYLFLLLFFTLSLIANEPDKKNTYNEYMVDLYYANGIMMQEVEDKAREIWQIRANDLLRERPILWTRIANVEIAYNKSYGFTNDLFEAFLQKVALEPGYGIGWEVFKGLVGLIPQAGNTANVLLTNQEYVAKMIHDKTLNKQIKAYKESIKAGRGVVVVAHSQGNLFTAEAYKALGGVGEGDNTGWMQNYFEAVGIASPGHYSIKCVG